MKLLILWCLAAALFLAAGCDKEPMAAAPVQPEEEPAMTDKTEPAATGEPTEKATKTDAEWREILTKEQYYILREKGTERAGSGKYSHYKGQGVFVCAGCGLPLFDAKTKYDSGTGWPSFYAPIKSRNVEEHADNSLFMKRTEVVCARCGGHLGHVFPDGPKPTGLRYCMNSAALELKETKGEESEEKTVE